jgi:hypothetical protein
VAERSRQGCFASTHRDLGPAVRSTSSRSVSARADRVWLHDSALRLERERGYCIDTDSQGKVLNMVKKIERWAGRQLLPALPHVLWLVIFTLHNSGAEVRGIPHLPKPGRYGAPVIGYGPGGPSVPQSFSPRRRATVHSNQRRSRPSTKRLKFTSTRGMMAPSPTSCNLNPAAT